MMNLNFQTHPSIPPLFPISSVIKNVRSESQITIPRHSRELEKFPKFLEKLHLKN